MIHYIRKVSAVLAAAIAAIAISGCSMFITSRKALSSIQPGMTKEQVTALLGRPDLRRFDNRHEEWEYRSYDSSTTYTMITVKFTEGTVSGLDSRMIDRPKAPHMPGEKPGNDPHGHGPDGHGPQGHGPEKH